MTGSCNTPAKFRALVMMIALLLPALAGAGSWQRGISLGGFNNVNIYTPTSFSPIGPAQQRSLLLVLHGCVQPISNYDTANLEDAADSYGMVIAVPDAVNKAGFSCWSYWTGTKSRSSDDYQRLINLANTLSSDPGRGIDPDQVYISGLSSGASFANTTACLAPDVFAGVAVSAGPSIGTSSNGALGPCESADVAARCDSYAGSAYRQYFATQIASIAQGDADTTVNQCYNTQNSVGMAALYGVSELPGTVTVTDGAGRTAQETLWQNGRVSRLWFNGVDHAWSGGAGASGSFISAASINYAAYLGGFFAAYNQRVNRNTPPEISNLLLAEDAGRIAITATVTDTDGSVAEASAAISEADTGVPVATVMLTVAGSTYSGLSTSLADNLYSVTLSATDDSGSTSSPVTATVRIGPPPPPAAPAFSNIAATVAGQCVTVTGEVIDQNQDLDTVIATFSNGSVTATISGTSFTAARCGLPGGVNEATLVATDLSGLSTSESVFFSLDSGQTATLSEHINAGRLAYTNYADCYLEYASLPFTLSEIALSTTQCRWQDDDASCSGPNVACSGDGGDPGGGGDGGGTCEQQTTVNYYHKTSNRAYSTGAFFSPDYFANGSNDPMPGSTWGVNTLYSIDGVVWNRGECP